MKSLGSYHEFADWTGKSRMWGPDASWFANFGGDVVGQLAQGITDFRSELKDLYPSKAEPMPVAIGCVPWFTSQAVAQALAELQGQILVVVNKGDGFASPQVRDILETPAGGTFLQRILGTLAYMGPLDANGDGPIVVPDGPMPGDRLVGPLRVAGWKKPDKGHAPLLHAKLLVLGAWWFWDDGIGGEDEIFTPHKLWFGSANWTEASAVHIEFGAWTTDEALVLEATRFLEDLIAFSEPIGAATAGPEPEFVAAKWDDELFAEAADALRDMNQLDEDQ